MGLIFKYFIIWHSMLSKFGLKLFNVINPKLVEYLFYVIYVLSSLWCENGEDLKIQAQTLKA